MTNQTALVGDELLISVFAQFGKKRIFKITDESDIIKAFYKTHRKYPALFENYSFDHDGIYPDSRELSEAIDAIMQARMIGRMNLDLKDYHIFEAVNLRYKNYIKPRLDGKTLRQIKKLSEEIGKFLQIRMK